MAGRPAPTRVGLLAPMEPELAPLVRLLSLERDGGGVHRGRAGDVEVVALLTTMGMAPAAAAARRMLEHDVARIMVVGIAGGVDRAIPIGAVIAPATVVDRATGRAYRPEYPAGTATRGALSCGDELLTDAAALDVLAAQGVIAVDMETAAVAEACTEAGIPWTAFRSISDYAGEGLVDDALFALTNPDGTADREAVERYLAENPDRREALVRLARDSHVAVEAAAAAAVDALRALGRR